MAALSTVALVGSAVIGAGAAVASVNQQSKYAKQQADALEQQEEDAKTALREQAGLDTTREDAGATVNLGSDSGSTTSTSTRAGSGGATSRTGSVANKVGGLGNARSKYSKALGL